MSEVSGEIARIDARAEAARAALGQTLSALADRADVTGRVKARTAAGTRTSLPEKRRLTGDSLDL
ncbi:DUF3618 domain-containing protein, partial [Catellatospora sp. NPDC049609]|uniref:DUF3618 domain-containing protein n=1 Tax=Catellatospora sp. NPDC049609 TaxID=3155505 RepID=UPI00341F34F0